MSTRSNDHLEKAYQSGHATNHHEGLRAVYQLGRADEAAALAPKLEIEAEPESAVSQDSPTTEDGNDETPAGTETSGEVPGPLDSPVTSPQDIEPDKAAE